LIEYSRKRKSKLVCCSRWWPKGSLFIRYYLSIGVSATHIPDFRHFPFCCVPGRKWLPIPDPAGENWKRNNFEIKHVILYLGKLNNFHRVLYTLLEKQAQLQGLQQQLLKTKNQLNLLSKLEPLCWQIM